jgi:16S rRNA processing protein RimM
VSAAGGETAPRRLRAGIVGRAHGLDGSFHVSEVAAEVFAIVELGGEVEIGGRTRRVARLAGHAGRPILRLEGAGSRDDAEALRGEAIWIARAEAPELEEDEWWAEDLEGCAVRDGERAVGTVARLLALPSCEVLEVRWADDPERQALLVPLVRDAVRDVDLDAKVIDVDLGFLGEA